MSVYLPDKEARKMDPFIQYGMVAGSKPLNSVSKSLMPLRRLVLSLARVSAVGHH